MTPARIPIPESDAALLAQCEMHMMRPGGKGGQHANSNATAVRLIHLPTGISTISRRDRSQAQNRDNCIEQLRRKLGKLNERKKPRHATKEPRRVKEKVLRGKKQRGDLKKSRRRPGGEE